MGMRDTTEYSGLAMRRMAWCGVVAVLAVATVWWAVDKAHKPGWYVFVSGLAIMGMYLVGIFLWDWFCRFLWWVSGIRGKNDPDDE